MMIYVIDAAIEMSTLAAPGGGNGRTLLVLLATREVADVRKRLQEDSAMDAEDVLRQAEEALVIG